MSCLRDDLIRAIRCCREKAGGCERCPMQEEICDQLTVETAEVPTELLELIEIELECK